MQAVVTHKEAATSFLRLALSGRVREAFDQFVDAGFRHHNAYFKGGAKALQAAMEQNAEQNPDKLMNIIQVLEDGGLVAVHSHVRLKPGDRGVAMVHIFRFHGDRIVELWDIGQPVPDQSPNENGMF